MNGTGKSVIAACLMAASVGCGGADDPSTPVVPAQPTASPNQPISTAPKSSASNSPTPRIRPNEAPATHSVSSTRQNDEPDLSGTEVSAEDPQAAAIFAELVAAHRDSDIPAWEKASGRLDELGAAGIPTYVKHLADDDPMIREFAMMKLARLGPEASPAVDACVKGLADSSQVVRINAAATLSILDDPRRTRAVPVLEQFVAEEHDEFRVLAVVALGNLGPDAASAVPALVTALAAEDVELRRSAAETLGLIGPQANAAIPALEQRAADDENTDVRIAARDALEQVAEVGDESEPRTKRNLADRVSPARLRRVLPKPR